MSAGQAVKVFAQPAKKVIHHTHISVTKEIAMGLGLGLIAGLGWKQYHWHYMKEKKAWYDGVAAGKINPFAEAAVEIEE